MSDTEHDPDFEAFLKRRSPIHRRLSDFDHAEPSVDLDRVVLNRARAAIETPAQPPMYRATRWAMPVGLAATILIAFTVLLNIDHKAEKKAAPLAATTSVAAPAAPAVMERALPPGAAVAHADAESWLREIAELRAAGKTAEADQELVAFQKVYPTHAGAGVGLARPPTK